MLLVQNTKLGMQTNGRRMVAGKKLIRLIAIWKTINSQESDRTCRQTQYTRPQKSIRMRTQKPLWPTKNTSAKLNQNDKINLHWAWCHRVRAWHEIFPRVLDPAAERVSSTGPEGTASWTVWPKGRRKLWRISKLEGLEVENPSL